MTTTPKLPPLPAKRILHTVMPEGYWYGHVYGYSESDIRAYALAAYQAGRDAAYEAGWREAALWAGRGDLIADIGSPAYERDKAEALKGAAPSP